jgi:uncharacterized membrane protein YcaP (DUF421 family)
VKTETVKLLVTVMVFLTAMICITILTAKGVVKVDTFNQLVFLIIGVVAPSPFPTQNVGNVNVATSGGVNDNVAKPS